MRYLSYAGNIDTQATDSLVSQEDLKGDAFVRPILWNCDKLEVLDIIGMPDFSGNAFFCDRGVYPITGAPSTADASLSSPSSVTPSPHGNAEYPILQNLSQLNIQATDVTDLSLKHILRVCPSLIAISVANCSKLTFGREDAKSGQSVWNLSKSLCKIELSDDLGLERALQECPRLSQLSCCYLTMDPEQEHTCTFDKVVATNLTKLSLIYCFKMANLDKLLPQLPNLVNLDLCDMIGVTETFMLLIAKSCPNLEHLNMSNSKIEETINWKKVLSSFPSLKEFCANCHAVTESLMSLQDEYPHINIHL